MVKPAPATRGEFRVWKKFTTRWADNDAYGHVNNTIYYEWFDSAVNGWLIEAGLLDIAAGDPIALVATTSSTYFTPLAFPQNVEIGLAIAELGKSSVRYSIGVFAAGGDLAAAQGEFVHVLVDRASRRPVPIPGTWRQKLEALAR
ncbi:MAG: thioesterase family protein [Sphingomicrobium sp.]